MPLLPRRPRSHQLLGLPLSFVNREESARFTARCWRSNVENPAKLELLLAGHFFGAGKTYFGMHLVAKIGTMSAAELGISPTLHEAIKDALTLRFEIKCSSDRVFSVPFD